MDNLLIDYIKKNIKDNNVIFVFPTQVAAEGWADWVLKNSAETGVSSLSMNRFIAWDDFKGSHIRAAQKDLQSIRTLMRKVFASHIIEKNAQLCEKGEPLFQSLITPKYAKNAASFSDWISKILPSLQLWKDYHESEEYKALAKKKQICENDAEDHDYETLYEEYSAFLKENKKFDPAWIKPPFTPQGNERYCIVYPEILEDWAQYRTLLQNAKEIELLSVEKHTQDYAYESVHFDSSVQEIREAALFLREKHKAGIEWTSMTVSVSDIENYAPYIERAFSFYEIPYTVRRSQTLTSHLAGSFFEQIQNCVSENFSFDSVRRLLLNDAIPWKNKNTINALISFGRKNNCLCSFSGNDIWEEAFENPVHLKSIDKDEAVEKEKYLCDFYTELKEKIKAIVKSKTFKAILANYKEFKKSFIDSEGFDEMPLSDKIISRCISELYALIELQDEYKINTQKEDRKIFIPNCYSFFVKHLSTVQYLEQLSERAVQVYPYRTSAAAPYEIHVVLGATQDLLSVGTMFKQLSFLSDEKRKLILEITPGEKSAIQKLSELDPSEYFIRLYQINSKESAYFFSSHLSPSGYGFPHGALKTKSASKDEKLSLRYDIATAEKYALLGKDIPESETYAFSKCENEKDAFPSSMLKLQKKGFEQWKEMHDDDAEKSDDTLSKNKIRSAIDNTFKDKKTGKYKISQTSISAFYKCPRKWLFERVLKLKPLVSEAQIIDEFLMGKINHSVLQEYCTALKDKSLQLTAVDDFTLYPEYKEILSQSIDKALKKFLEEKKDEKNEWDKTLSFMTKTVAGVQRYSLEETMEKSIAKLSFDKRIKGSFVLATEKQCAEYAPEGEDYALLGTIDCVIRNGDDIILLDYKTGSVPSYVTLKEDKKGEEPDFQFPYYTELYERETGENVSAAFFYSISKRELKEVFNKGDLTQEQKEMSAQELAELSEIDSKNKALLTVVDFAKTRLHCLKKTHEFCEAMKSLDFGTAAKSENCVSSQNYGQGCLDYVAICRMFFTVSGENTQSEND